MTARKHHHVMSGPFAEYAAAIGFTCMQWTFLEVMIDQLLLALVPIASGAVGNSVTSNIDIRDKMQIALAVGLIKKPDDKWFHELKTVLDEADNDLRNKRNRYAHDFWVLDEEFQVKKIQFKTTLKQTQAKKPLELTTLHETEVTAAEIWAAADAISVAAGAIALLTQQFGMLTRRTLRQKSS